MSKSISGVAALPGFMTAAAIFLNASTPVYGADAQGRNFGTPPKAEPVQVNPPSEGVRVPGSLIIIKGQNVNVQGLAPSQLECMQAISQLTSRGYSLDDVLEYNIGQDLERRLQGIGANRRGASKRGGCRELMALANSTRMLDDGPRQALPIPLIQASLSVGSKVSSTLNYTIDFPPPKSGMVYGDPVKGEKNSRKWPKWSLNHFEARLISHSCANIKKDSTFARWREWSMVSARGSATLSTHDVYWASIISGKICLEVRAIGSGSARPVAKVEIPVSMRYSKDEIIQATSGPFVILGFGDSYGSGEGNPTDYVYDESFIYGGRVKRWWTASHFSNASKANDPIVLNYTNFCHRSSASGLGKAVQMLERGSESKVPQDVRFGHFACSGATSRHLFDSAFRGNYQPAIFSSLPDYPPQVTVANQWLSGNRIQKKDVDAVVISIGGNDVGFTSLIENCILFEFTCHEIPEVIAIRDQASKKASDLVQSIGAKMSQEYPNAKIYFTAYPDGLAGTNKRTCSKLDASEYNANYTRFPNDPNWDIEPYDAVLLRNTQLFINAGLARGVDTLKSRLGQKFVLIDKHTKVAEHGFCAYDRHIMLNDEAVKVQGADYKPIKLPTWLRGAAAAASIIMPGPVTAIAGYFLIPESFQQPLYSSGGWHPNNKGYNAYGDAIYEKLSEKVISRNNKFKPAEKPLWR